MKRELQFFARMIWQYITVVVGATAILIVGMLVFHQGSNLFMMYGAIYPVFVALFPFLFAMSAKCYVSMAISFGARRLPCFAAVEITYSALAACMVAMGCIVNVVYNRLVPPDELMSVADIGLMTPVLEFCLAFLLLQISLASVNIMNTAVRVVVIIFAALLPMGAVIGIFMGASRNSDVYAVLQQIAVPAALILFAVSLVIAYFVARSYKKVVYSV